MEKNIEIEFKLLLSLEDYNRLLPLFKDVIPYTQTNYYFDTKNHYLRSIRNTLRVRYKNDKYEFTLKRQGINGLDEYNEAITKQQFEALQKQERIESQILDILQQEEHITIDMLYPNYSLTTKRYDLPYLGGLMSLDHSKYLGVEDYELEYEVPDYHKGLQIFKEFLKPYGLTYTTNCHGKRHRIFDELERTGLL